MDPTTLTIGGLAAGCLILGVNWMVTRRALRSMEALKEDYRLDYRDMRKLARKFEADIFDHATVLAALRHHCFIINDLGHRVRYVNASQEARAKAEGN